MASAAALLLGVWGCVTDDVAGPAIRPRLAVFAVLDPGAAEQVVLVEQTSARTGTAAGSDAPGDSPGDSLDPIVAQGGTPVRDARVVVYDERGDSAVAVEDALVRRDGRGRGVYRFGNRAAPGALAIVPGATYRLAVSAPLAAVTARTTVPAPSSPVDSGRRTIDVGQTLRLVVPAAVGAAPPLLVTSDSPEVAQLPIDDRAPTLIVARSCPTGGRRLPSSDEQPGFCMGLTYPGFTQRVALSSVDSNYRNFLRTGLDPFGSVDRSSSIVGGVGVFGSVVLRVARTVTVTAQIDRPIEGRFVAELRPDSLPAELTLYSLVEGAPRTNDDAPLSGNHRDGAGRLGGGVLGDLAQDSLVVLELFRGMRLSGSRVSLSARFSGTTLRVLTTDGRTVQAVYRKR